MENCHFQELSCVGEEGNKHFRTSDSFNYFYNLENWNLICSEKNKVSEPPSSIENSSVDVHGSKSILVNNLLASEYLSKDRMTSKIPQHYPSTQSCQNINTDVSFRISNFVDSSPTPNNNTTINKESSVDIEHELESQGAPNHHCQKEEQQQQQHIQHLFEERDVDKFRSQIKGCHFPASKGEDGIYCRKHPDVPKVIQTINNLNNRRNDVSYTTENTMTSTDSLPSSSSPSSSLSFPSRWLGLHLGMWLRLVLTCSVMVASIVPANARPMTDADRMYKKRQMDTVKYLAQFGYLKGPSRETQNLRSREELERAIKALQKAGGLPQTGVADARTENLLMKPRCGNKDEHINDGRYSNYRFRSAAAAGRRNSGDGYSSSKTHNIDDGKTYRYRRRRSLSRQKRFTTSSSSWKHTDLTFRFVNYTPDIPQSKTRRIISNALRVWSDATPLSFTELRESEADIMIQFASNYHSDGYPFDGKGMVLAHAFFPGPGKGGDTHFDDDENWGTNSSEGVDLFMVAAHEFGHALGLSHSGDPEALMYPWYMGFQGKFKLPQDDYLGITNLYGSKEKNRIIPTKPRPEDGVVMIPKPDVPGRHPRPDYDVTTPKVKEEDSGPSDPCNSRIDALTVFRSELFVFVGKWFWRLDSRKMITEPVEIHSFWYGLPKHLERIDAVYERPDSKLVFFSGDRYWIFNANHLKSGFPTEGRPITEFNIPADVKKIDAAFVWGYNKRTYLVSGDMYWKMNEDNRFVEYDYPRDMGTWKGVPVPLDSAFRDWNGKTYFFKGLEYSEFYDMKMEVRKGYPKQFSRHMLNCPKVKANQMDGRNSELGQSMSSRVVPPKVGNSNRLKQDDTAISLEKSTVENKNKEGFAPLSVSSSVSLIISTLFLCLFANKLAAMDL